jgi:hypothetical protein
MTGFASSAAAGFAAGGGGIGAGVVTGAAAGAIAGFSGGGKGCHWPAAFVVARNDETIATAIHVFLMLSPLTPARCVHGAISSSVPSFCGRRLFSKASDDLLVELVRLREAVDVRDALPGDPVRMSL